MAHRKRFVRTCLPCVAVAGTLLLAVAASLAADKVWHFDCGTADSPVMKGYKQLTSADLYAKDRGYGWETKSARALEFKRPVRDRKLRGSWGQLLLEEAFDNHRNDLNRDAVVSEDDLIFRLDAPNGRYRVGVTIGDLSKAIGSMDILFNSEKVGDQVAAWAPGGYRMLDRTPAGWWTSIRSTVEVKDGLIRISLQENQSYYDRQMIEQAAWETPYKRWYHRTPIIQDPPYFYIGYPFVYNSVMAIDVTPYTPGPVVCENDQLKLAADVASPALREAIKDFNAKDFAGAQEALDRVTGQEALAAKAVVSLWLSGRLEVEKEKRLVPAAAKILRQHVAGHPDAHGIAEMLGDAEIFIKALNIHLTRGELYKNHFLENDKAIGWWWMIQPDSPLYYKTQLYIARAAHMLKPYFPTIGTEGEIFKKLEEKFPGNRFVKYHLHQQWRPYGDGSDYYDWIMGDYEAKAEGAPDWVRAIYPAFADLVDLSEWWIKFRQLPEGAIGGGWGDDVEMVGLFGYYGGYVSRGISDISLQGTRNLVNGVWNLSEVDPELGFCLPMADAEHTAEWTGNTLGMMVQIDHGNPTWIERSMKTGKLIRDLWTDYNRNGRRHFRANFFGAAEVGRGDRMNDSWINYRAVSAASSVLWYNQNPTISKLFVELAEAWLTAAMSTDRGKPKGIIPTEVSFPDEIIGGVNSPNWWTASHSPGTVNHDWIHQSYKGYISELLMTAYRQTRDPKFLEPFRLEYELALKHGYKPDASERTRRRRRRGGAKTSAEPGSEEWVAANLQGTYRWLEAERLIKGRQGDLESQRSKAEIIENGRRISQQIKTRWPIMTSEAGPTDRVAFVGITFPFFVYTGGAMGGPLLRTAVTYQNTTKDFAAAVMAADPQGLRILYYSLASDTREIGVLPWELEVGGAYRLRYGVDDNDDEKMDRLVEDRGLVFPQAGSPIYIRVEPRTSYVIEIEQTQRGRGPELAPDPGLSTDDIRYESDSHIVLARIHNVGSKPVRNVKVVFYDGDPKADGKHIGMTTIPNIEAPVDLEPRTVTVGMRYPIEGEPRDIYVVVDPDDDIRDEITAFNNVAHAKLPRPEKGESKPVRKPAPPGAGFRRGR